MESKVIDIRMGRLLARPAADPLAVALAFYVQGGMTEAEALCTLHKGVLGRADALGVHLEGEKE